jgi:hypothetical protein
MSTPPNSHKQCCTQAIDAWLRAAQETRAALHIKAAGPWNSNERYEAFAAMSELLLQAFEEVRMVSEALREGSHVVRGASAELRTHSTQLLQRGTTLMERMAQFVPPSPKEMQEADSRLLAMFKGEKRPSEQ